LLILIIIDIGVPVRPQIIWKKRARHFETFQSLAHSIFVFAGCQQQSTGEEGAGSFQSVAGPARKISTAPKPAGTPHKWAFADTRAHGLPRRITEARVLLSRWTFWLVPLQSQDPERSPN
jgi:hypothetical protein